MPMNVFRPVWVSWRRAVDHLVATNINSFKETLLLRLNNKKRNPYQVLVVGDQSVEERIDDRVRAVLELADDSGHTAVSTEQFGDQRQQHA